MDNNPDTQNEEINSLDKVFPLFHIKTQTAYYCPKDHLPVHKRVGEMIIYDRKVTNKTFCRISKGLIQSQSEDPIGCLQTLFSVKHTLNYESQNNNLEMKYFLYRRAEYIIRKIPLPNFNADITPYSKSPCILTDALDITLEEIAEEIKQKQIGGEIPFFEEAKRLIIMNKPFTECKLLISLNNIYAKIIEVYNKRGYFTDYDPGALQFQPFINIIYNTKDVPSRSSRFSLQKIVSGEMVETVSFHFAFMGDKYKYLSQVVRREWKTRMSQPSLEMTDNCCICFESYSDDVFSPTILSGCQHCFCILCVEKWAKRNSRMNKRRLECPLCRTRSRDFIRNAGVENLKKIIND